MSSEIDRSSRFAFWASIILNIVMALVGLTYTIIECGKLSNSWSVFYYYTPGIYFIIVGWWNYLIGLHGSFTHEQGSAWEAFKVKATKWPTIVYSIVMLLPYIYMFVRACKIKPTAEVGIATLVSASMAVIGGLMASSYPKPEKNR
jgi:hypothetical protein